MLGCLSCAELVAAALLGPPLLLGIPPRSPAAEDALRIVAALECLCLLDLLPAERDFRRLWGAVTSSLDAMTAFRALLEAFRTTSAMEPDELDLLMLFLKASLALDTPSLGPGVWLVPGSLVGVELENTALACPEIGSCNRNW